MNLIDYGKIMINSMHQVVIEVLSHVEQHGLCGENHFVIKFSTDHDNVRLPPHLLEQYPNSMTIVLQHQFENLKVNQAGFAVTLSFDDRPESIFVPIDAVRSFTDPSAKFNLTFPDLRELDSSSGTEHHATATPDADDTDKPAEPGEKSATIVSLDQFRNKPT